jgi:hypothetical protein
MNYNSTNLTNIEKLTENSYTFTQNERLYFLMINNCIEYLNIKLTENYSIINYTSNLYLPDTQKNNLFKTCKNMNELRDTIEEIFTKKNIMLDTKDKKQIVLTLSDSQTSFEIIFKVEEIIAFENITIRINDSLNMLYHILNDNEGKMHYIEVSTLARSKLEDIRLRYKISQPFEEILFSIDGHIKFLFSKYKSELIKYLEHGNQNDLKIIKQVEIKLNNDKKKPTDEKLQDKPQGSSNPCSSHQKTDDENLLKRPLLDALLDIKIQNRDLDISHIDSKRNSLIQNKDSQNTTKVTSAYCSVINNSRSSILINNVDDLTSQAYAAHNKIEKDVKPLKENSINIKQLTKLTLLQSNVIIGTHKSCINSIILLNKFTMASASDDKTIKVWNTDNFTFVKTLRYHDGSVYCLALISEDLFASGSHDKTICIWDVKNNYNCIKSLFGHKDCVSCLLLLSDGKLASGSSDRAIKIWDSLNHFKCIYTIPAHNSTIRTLINLSDDLFASGSYDMTVKCWDYNFNCVNTLQVNSSIYSLLRLKDSGDLIIGSADPFIKLRECRSNFSSQININGHTAGIMALLLFNESYLISGSCDNTIKVWDIENDFKCIFTLKGHSSTVRCLLNLNENILVSASHDHSIRAWKFSLCC